MNKKLVVKQKYSDFDSEVIPHLNSLKSYALKMTNDLDNSEDLLQDTLLKAFRFFHNYEKGSNAKAWLFKIMHNSFINNYHKKVKQPFKVDYEDVQNFYENIKPDDVKSQHYQQDAFDNVLNDEILKAFSVLPDNFRTIVFLCDIEGYSYKEVSDFVVCPIGTVRSRLHRTRKILYALLYKYAIENGYVRSKNIKDNKIMSKSDGNRTTKKNVCTY
jgi:RNA polymerase sigma-70 factor, ECF subfamily